MAFYLLPPSGNISYQRLEDYALNRLRFLLRLSCCKTPVEVRETLEDASFVHQSDCLISGSSRDAVSHYILRLALCEDKDTRAFICFSELALFKQRLSDLDCEEWKCFLLKTEKDLSQLLRIGIPSTDSFLADLEFVLGILSHEFCSWHAASQEIYRQSTKIIQLPFHLVLGLIGRREVTLSKGLASVPLSQLHCVLGELFQRNMEMGLYQALAQRDVIKYDPRIKRLAAVLKRTYRTEIRASQHLPSSVPRLELSSLWSQTELMLFPPCMLAALEALKRDHRLGHNDRIQLTLFLKELGLSLHEALLLWKQEYSKPPSLPITPNKHGWQGNERRYIYNIRHLYGLEGGRVNYCGHRCTSIQDRSLSILDHGGCPFSSIEELLTSKTTSWLTHSPDFPIVKGLVEQKQCGLACSHFMKSKIKLRHSSVNAVRDLKFSNSDKSRDFYSVRQMQPNGTCDAKSEVLCHESVMVESKDWEKSSCNCNEICDRPVNAINETSSFTNLGARNTSATALIDRKKYKRLFKRRSKIVTTSESKKSRCLLELDERLTDKTIKGNGENSNSNVGSVSNADYVESLYVDIKKPSDYYRCYVTLLNSVESLQ